jgi:hypothetical protein
MISKLIQIGYYWYLIKLQFDTFIKLIELLFNVNLYQEKVVLLSYKQ